MVMCINQGCEKTKVSTHQIADYSTFYNAVFALLRTVLGDFNFVALERTNRILGPIFFITYVFFVFFVLLVGNASLLV
ncbi:hypothetical protein Y032_0095g2868 [Ancylostoma ceylanicum]|uniref:Polycystin cation channel PKD1/PKD2 domain-containing protein n=1 Tax=Ancylostoma ceylanicum TaxID=53326 RepID=A0A016TJZ3_9BILA|nr:hypothetical protein Y032_0095g2868 [Ancylostoma ceylanicum]